MPSEDTAGKWVFAPSVEGRVLAFDVLGADTFGAIDGTVVDDFPLAEDAVKLDAVAVEAERSAFHSTDDSVTSAIPDRFAPVWRVSVPTVRPVRLPSSSDGPFRAPAWLTDVVSRVPRRDDGWPQWPVEVTIVGSFVNADDEEFEEARAALAAVRSDTPARLSVVTTGAGLHQVRLRLRATSPDELDEVAGTALASLDSAGALLHREHHRAFLAALHGPFDD